jgi:hypothetical protein
LQNKLEPTQSTGKHGRFGTTGDRTQFHAVSLGKKNKKKKISQPKHKKFLCGNHFFIVTFFHISMPPPSRATCPRSTSAGQCATGKDRAAYSGGFAGTNGSKLTGSEKACHDAGKADRASCSKPKTEARGGTPA